MIKNFFSYVGIFITLVAFVFLAYVMLFYDKKADWEGILVKEEPSQVDMNSSQPFEYKNSVITPIAYYNIKGIVLSTSRYFTDDMADISPIDIVIGWNRMSEASVLNKFKVTQENRAYNVVPKQKTDIPIEYKEVMFSSSNNSCIPANDEVMEKLGRLKQYDYVSIRGLLVSVKKEGFNPWVSSLVRYDDFKDNSYVGSEILYVDRVEIIEKNKN